MFPSNLEACWNHHQISYFCRYYTVDIKLIVRRERFRTKDTPCMHLNAGNASEFSPWRDRSPSGRQCNETGTVFLWVARGKGRELVDKCDWNTLNNAAADFTKPSRWGCIFMTAERELIIPFNRSLTLPARKKWIPKGSIVAEPTTRSLARKWIESFPPSNGGQDCWEFVIYTIVVPRYMVLGQGPKYNTCKSDRIYRVVHLVRS